MKPNEFGHIQQQVSAIEKGLPADASRSLALHHLQELGLNDYLQTLWYMPDARYPRLSAALPAMASPEVQMQWTGQSDLPLIIQTTSFVRSVAEHYVRLQNEPLTDKKILDFGCGYGRMLRAFSFYSNNVYGVDPWSEFYTHLQ
ncbi:class I SAM-dependent methyltransferase [Phyllobacterium zundukense]|uniref:Class I SAM-dependent methyltransferase n=1 Tax=Phyllobacterium zundukense TaxID=1867719 RepID=A0ACD4CZS1_9HYPH|nr:class I SAM-dependent methyltransferase [Phyllobacterium zundukense]UXN58953.1 class I SAM-dependent methyltransferase [Phyllobacterium zundukense]